MTEIKWPGRYSELRKIVSRKYKIKHVAWQTYELTEKKHVRNRIINIDKLIPKIQVASCGVWFDDGSSGNALDLTAIIKEALKCENNAGWNAADMLKDPVDALEEGLNC